MSFDASDRASLGERLSRSDVVMSLKLKLISVFFFFFFSFFLFSPGASRMKRNSLLIDRTCSQFALEALHFFAW